MQTVAFHISPFQSIKTAVRQANAHLKTSVRQGLKRGSPHYDCGIHLPQRNNPVGGKTTMATRDDVAGRADDAAVIRTGDRRELELILNTNVQAVIYTPQA